MLNEIAALLQHARHVVVLTGAGVSAESGIPTFRDALTGLWARYDPETLATPAAFARDPELVTRWYDERRGRCGLCRPNPGHFALAELEDRLVRAGRGYMLLSQNVDRLHQAAGSKNVVELHGSIWVWRCTQCGAEKEERGAAFEHYPPRCACGGLRRPGVVWFGETLSSESMESAHQALSACDVFLSLGTSAVVEPAAGFIHLAQRRRAKTVEINVEATPISDIFDYSLRGKTGVLLPEMLNRFD
jgi:NAD-dependent deacetylase